jgi:RNA recognition motif. (a.k.a. RRM, RBD, or RNP domain)
MPHSNSSSPRPIPANTSIAFEGDGVVRTSSREYHRSPTDYRQPQGTDTGISMVEFNNALPHVSGPTPQSYLVSAPQLQYQQSPPTYAVGQYQQYSGSHTPATYGSPDIESGMAMNEQYYTYPLGQQQLDASQAGYQFGGQSGGYQSTVPTLVGQQQFATERQMQQQSPSPQFQYPQSPPTYPQQPGRAMSYPAIYPTPQPNRHPTYMQQASPYQMYPPSFMSHGEYHLSHIDHSAGISSDPENLLPRGPPRKPKQSGFALWVGNLPRDVSLEELKEFFAMNELESIFLIQKSNCAFVNYKTEEACSTALSMFNDRSTTLADGPNFSVQKCSVSMSSSEIISKSQCRRHRYLVGDSEFFLRIHPA